MTEYFCIECGDKWEIDDGNPDRRPNGGLCKSHLKEKLIPIYRSRQLAEGNFPCFATATDYCDQGTCSFRKQCLV